ncbi:GAP family protein [Ornithinimicrobium sp. F0845]|uniref:GAP family protein n=1 Tax=Ornithinimicrobium sp. F0845 TaxID=2926412 RepID=UPI001FF670F5|nr:GAP family protein [Ornithinimicrobium sp. F0845]MCK0112191.1 GAP family protein [Ornithinimicrobium sp. F0845]
MTFALAGGLLALALIDSTSFGTLLIPIWFLLAPGRPAAGRMLIFLGTVAAFYFGVGVALLLGLDAVLGQVNGWLDNPALLGGQLALGVALLVWSFFIGRKRKEGSGSGRLTRWRERALGQHGTGGTIGLVSLALGAALLEVATMLPYLGAIGLLTTSDLTLPVQLGTLAVYCLVMILPALVLLGARFIAHRQVEPLLRRIARWMERSAGEMTAWIVGIVGFLLARDALARMPGLVEFLDRL